ncbi:MAG TPA: hypothetical protein VMW27_24900 [Thermoanaerobaculia bacterium]|nr:hypothetical protein [Thermoanaerobaculia bacterium]
MSSESQPPPDPDDWNWEGKPVIPVDYQPAQPGTGETGEAPGTHDDREAPLGIDGAEADRSEAGGARDAGSAPGASDSLYAQATRCVLMGPSKAGKTTLIHSFDQACSSPFDPDDPFRLEFIGGRGTKVLAELAGRTVMEEDYGIEPTDRIAHYEASITVTEAKTFWRTARQHVAHLAFRDGPGGALFPTEPDETRFSDLAVWEEELIRDGRGAGALVLCVDATDPKPDLVSRYMRNILANLGQRYQPDLVEPPGYRMLKALHLARPVPALKKERRIPPRRFLLLFTKVDQLVDAAVDWPEDAPPEFEPPRPVQLASRLGPVQVACELLDESNLLRIANALQPEADFAVGLTSAWGFNPFTGRPFMEENNPVGPSNQSRSRRFLNWRPFGVREALLFMVTGKARQPVQRVDPRTLQGRLRNRAFDVPHQFFRHES